MVALLSERPPVRPLWKEQPEQSCRSGPLKLVVLVYLEQQEGATVGEALT